MRCMSKSRHPWPSFSGSADGSAARDLLAASIEQHHRPPLCDVLRPRGLGPYRGYGELLGAVAGLASRGARVEVIGRSVKREPLFAVHLGDPSAKRPRTAV